MIVVVPYREGNIEDHRKGSEELVKKVASILSSHSIDVDILRYPYQGERSVDLITSTKLMIKISKKLMDISKREINELKAAAYILNSFPLIVSEYFTDDKIESGIVFEKNDIDVIDPETLDMYLSGEKVSIYSRKGMFYVRINGKMLERYRRERGMSLGDLANILGVSRKSVYEYEKGLMDPSVDIAEKLLDVFGEEIIDSYDIPDENTLGRIRKHIIRQAITSSISDPIVKEITKTGGEAVKLNNTAPDIVSRINENKVLIVRDNENVEMDELERKIEESRKFERFIKCGLLLVTINSRRRKVIEKEFDIDAVELDSISEYFRHID